MNPGDRPALSVARYLRADEQVVPFRARPELDELLAWCGAAGRVRVRLVTGDGGAGKTRLALRLCKDLSAEGWRSLWVHPGREANAAEAVRALGPCVLVVDYAENRDGLRSMLSEVVAGAAAPDVRVVLLARGPGEWWQRLTAGSQEQVARLLVEPPIVLGPVQVEGGPAVLFDEALTAFADKLGIPRPDVPLTLADPEPVVLEVHAAALLAVLDNAQGGGGATSARSAAEVLDELLGHEGRYWAQSATARGLDLDVAVQRLAVAVGCLIGADSETAAAELMRRVPDLSDSAERRGQVVRWLHDLYPETLPPDDGPVAWLGPLRPDPVAERLILTELEARPELVPDLFTGVTGAQAVHALTVLARASLRTPTGLGVIRSALAGDLEHMAVPALAVAINTNLVLGDLLAEAITDQPVPGGVLHQLADAMPASFALAPLAVTVLRMLADQSTDPDERAGLLLSLAGHLARLGNPPESLAAAKEAVKIRRRQVSDNPDIFQPQLALALNDQTNALAAMNRWRDALASAKEAVKIRRDLARDAPDTFLPDLAMSLNNQARCQFRLGHPGKALAAADEAIKIRRGLVDERPEIRPGLAATLNNKALSLTALHRPEEALAAAEEATSIYRDLANDRPDTFLHAYATSLNDLATSLVTHTDPDRREQALAAAEEATRIFRLLAMIRGGGYLSDLAVSLHNQSVCLTALGRDKEAQAAMTESTQIRGLLTDGSPQAR